jgi:hypothetical protein
MASIYITLIIYFLFFLLFYTSVSNFYMCLLKFVSTPSILNYKQKSTFQIHWKSDVFGL